MSDHVRLPRLRPVWFDAVLVATPIFLLFLCTASYAGAQVNDAASAFTSAWAVARHGTLDMGISPSPKAWFVSIDGHQYSDRLPGIIAWAIPFYALLGLDKAPTTFPAGIAAASATALAMGMMFCIFARIAPRRVAAVGVVLAALSTSTWTVSGHVLWAQGVDQMWLAMLLLGAASRRWWLAGLASALAITCRPPLALVSAIVGIGASIRERRPRPALVVGCIASLGVVTLLTYNDLVFGRLRIFVGSYTEVASAYTGNSKTANAFDPLFILENIAGTLASPARGVIVISPALLMLVPGLRAAWRAAPGWVRDATLAGLVLELFQCLTISFAGGSSFYGYRYALEPLTLCSPLLVLAWTQWTSRLAWRRIAFGLLSIFAIWANVASLFSQPAANTAMGKAWHHYQLAEALARVGAGGWTVLGLIAAALVALLVASEGRRPSESDRSISEDQEPVEPAVSH